MEILFEDKDIIVAVKPSGILSQADSKGSESMVSLLENHTGNAVHPVHRLDKETGGVMVYAKNKQTAAFLSREIAEHRLNKKYLCIVHGKPSENEGEYTDLLFRDRAKNKSYVVKRERKGVKRAELSYKVLVTKEELSLVLVALFTGRTHQIRLQFASRKTPLIGDRRYGSQDEFKFLGLWAYYLSFTHPRTKKSICFRALPKDNIAEYFDITKITID